MFEPAAARYSHPYACRLPGVAEGLALLEYHAAYYRAE